MERVIAGETDVEKDIEASVFWNDDADISNPEAVPAIAQEQLETWLWSPERISATERK